MLIFKILLPTLFCTPLICPYNPCMNFVLFPYMPCLSPRFHFSILADVFFSQEERILPIRNKRQNCRLRSVNKVSEPSIIKHMYMYVCMYVCMYVHVYIMPFIYLPFIYCNTFKIARRRNSHMP
jgi:hypothetical protein